MLGLCLRRLAADWQARWGHPVFLVESFVDESHSRGTSYRACGFAAVGPTQGFGRASRDFYRPHGQPKQLSWRALRPPARRLLRQARWPEALAAQEAERAGPGPFRASALQRLVERWATWPEARRGHGLRHRQRFVLAAAAVSTLMGVCGDRAFENTARKFTQRQWRARRAQCHEDTGRYAAPSDSTFQRVLSQIEPRPLARRVGAWLAEQETGALVRLAIDGKVLRGRGRHDGKALQLLSAVTHHLRLTLDQIPVAEKSNEIPALPELLRQLKPRPGTLITADAMHGQQERARVITQEWGGDDLFGVKGNPDGILEKATRLLAPQAFSPSGPSAVEEGSWPAGTAAGGARGRQPGGDRTVRLLAGGSPSHRSRAI